MLEEFWSKPVQPEDFLLSYLLFSKNKVANENLQLWTRKILQIKAGQNNKYDNRKFAPEFFKH